MTFQIVANTKYQLRKLYVKKSCNVMGRREIKNILICVTSFLDVPFTNPNMFSNDEFKFAALFERKHDREAAAL